MRTLAFEPMQATDLGLTNPGAVSAAIPLFVIGILLWRRALPRVAALLALLAGTTLTHGWLYTAIHTSVGAASAALNAMTSAALGGVVPGGLALILAIVYILQITPDEATFSRLAAVRTRGLRLPTSTGRGYIGGRTMLASRRTKPRWPEKLGALGVGLVLPAVVTTIPGDAGAALTSAINVIGGLGATVLQHTIGIR
jgi:hypothetical protein